MMCRSRIILWIVGFSWIVASVVQCRPVDSSPVYNEITERNATLQSQMRNAAFKDISRMAFKALVSKDYRDKPLLTPEERKARRDRRRKNRRRHRGQKVSRQQRRRRLPGRRQAYVIATKNLLQTTEQCHTELFKQKVRVEGCLTKTVVNRFCHGTCQSFFIPRLRVQKLKPAFESCSACIPTEYSPALVTLQCPARQNTIVRRTVMKVKKCSCKSVQFLR